MKSTYISHDLFIIIIWNKYSHDMLYVNKYYIYRGGKIGRDSRTEYDTKLEVYGLRLNGFVSYLGWHDWPI